MRLFQSLPVKGMKDIMECIRDPLLLMLLMKSVSSIINKCMPSEVIASKLKAGVLVDS